MFVIEGVFYIRFICKLVHVKKSELLLFSYHTMSSCFLFFLIIIIIIKTLFKEETIFDKTTFSIV